MDEHCSGMTLLEIPAAVGGSLLALPGFEVSFFLEMREALLQLELQVLELEGVVLTLAWDDHVTSQQEMVVLVCLLDQSPDPVQPHPFVDIHPSPSHTMLLFGPGKYFFKMVAGALGVAILDDITIKGVIAQSVAMFVYRDGACVAAVTEDLAREALFHFVNSKCCYSRKPLVELLIQDFNQLSLYRYRLETFSEHRSCEWMFQPYTSQLIDGPEDGAWPQPWDVQVSAPNMFQENTRRLQVPHSSQVKARCMSCNGTRHRDKHKQCRLCAGSGRRRCSTCSGRGHKICTTCKGEGRLLHFLQLTITWKNDAFEFVSELQRERVEAFPLELLNKVHGKNVLMDENALVKPIIDFPDSEISQASLRGITEHKAVYANKSLILQQRQSVEWIPLTVVHCRYDRKRFLFYLYGLENRVYAPDYPKKHCCGCNIM
ncbi:protein SSUH2 homolog [Rhinatrema bivittatum]|uniref:protein SSUH2 homolog n=1 Tax=Rhinatrema bivittatum TaxID=194408 RepID=UPI001129E84C|nr:protein SSUH2 homolog [Rhinatrema bivittatum]